MTVPVYCTGDTQMVNDNTLTCTGDWHVYESDLLEFAHLLDFDLQTFGVLFGVAVVLFITGYSAGTTVRLLRRQ